MGSNFFPNSTPVKSFVHIEDEDKPIKIAVMGTSWSPTSLFTYQALINAVRESQYKDLVQTHFIDQDTEFPFCYNERIIVGFPTTIVMIGKVVLTFVQNEKAADSEQKQKIRLVGQLNSSQMGNIIEQAYNCYQKKRFRLTIPNQ